MLIDSTLGENYTKSQMLLCTLMDRYDMNEDEDGENGEVHTGLGVKIQ